MKQTISKILLDAIKEVADENSVKLDMGHEEVESLIEIPPVQDMGDYAFPCFVLAEKFKLSPKDIAIEIRKKISDSKKFQDIQTIGPYVNFFENRENLALAMVQEILSQKDNYGKVKVSKGKKVKTMIEFPAPNTNKPLHIGHLRNMAIGESISRISEFAGEKIIRANLNNDRGIHICKSMAAYKFYGKGKNPKKEKLKSDHFVGKFYTMFAQKVKSNEKLDIESHRMLQKYEQGNKSILALWRKMNKWALEGFEKTYERFGIKHDKVYNESEIFEKGKKIVMQGLKDKIFEKRKDSAVIINLKKEGLDEKVLLRIDGTSVYITQDLYLAQLKSKQFKLDKSYYVVGSEQEYHFKVLFSILKKLGFKQNMHHFSYGAIFLPGWKKIKSREGTKGITADEILDKVQELVKKELNRRYKLSKKEFEKRSLKITLAAVKYFLLKVDIKKNMIFDPKQSINFEGDTGPYIQYSYARASSILKKAKAEKFKDLKIQELESKELELIKKLSEFKEIVLKSYLDLNPSVIANYSYQLAQIFNEFYQECPVINSEQKNFRLGLVESFRQILKTLLYLLGIDVLEEM